MSEINNSKLEKFITLVKSSNFVVVSFLIVNLFMFIGGVFSQEVTICTKRCFPIASLKTHPFWFYSMMLIHSLILLYSFIAIRKALK
jgi:hypothetical protein